jgi:hypothetical protein
VIVIHPDGWLCDGGFVPRRNGHLVRQGTVSLPTAQA